MVEMGKTGAAIDTVSGTAAPASLTHAPCTTPAKIDKLTFKRKYERYTSNHTIPQEQDQYTMKTESVDGGATPPQNSINDGFISLLRADAVQSSEEDI
jgi:hypothetical protein